METKSQRSYLMEDMCFNNFLIRYGILKFNVFFLLRWWQNWTSKGNENEESSKREITWKSKEQNSYTEYNHTRAVRIKACFIKKHHGATCYWHEGKKILQGTLSNISPAKMSWQGLGKAVKCVTKALPRSPSKKKSVVCALAKSFGVMNTEKKVINLGLSASDKESIQNF